MENDDNLTCFSFSKISKSRFKAHSPKSYAGQWPKNYNSFWKRKQAIYRVQRGNDILNIPLFMADQTDRLIGLALEKRKGQ